LTESTESQTRSDSLSRFLFSRLPSAINEADSVSDLGFNASARFVAFAELADIKEMLQSYGSGGEKNLTRRKYLSFRAISPAHIDIGQVSHFAIVTRR
jgi:hypothetical protein